MGHSNKTQHRCQTEQMVLATDGQGIAAVLGGLALSALGVILLANLWGAARRFRELQDRFYPSPWVWPYRLIGLVGVVGGIVIIVFALT